mgnify:CR=1 FL=1
MVNPFTTNRLVQVATFDSLDDEVHYKKMLKSNHECKKYIYRELKELALFISLQRQIFLGFYRTAYENKRFIHAVKEVNSWYLGGKK